MSLPPYDQDLDQRPAQLGVDTVDREPAPRKGAPLPVAAVVATVWAAALTYLPVLLLVVTGGWGPSSVRMAGAAWLLGHGVALQGPADRITLVPLALTALVIWRLARAGVHASRAGGGHRATTVWRALGAGAAVAVVYAGIGAAIAALSTTPDVTIGFGRAALTTGLVAWAAASFGALWHSRAGRRLIRGLPRTVSDGVRGGLLIAALMLATGAAVAGVALALHGSDAADILASFDTGVAGQAGITVVCLAYAPDAAVWGTAYLLGPGFAVGAGTVVSPSEVVLGPVPALPIFAGLPEAPLTYLAYVLLPLPALAAVVGGVLVVRRTRVRGFGSALLSALLSAVVAGAAVLAAVAAARGSLGSGHLAQLGAAPLEVGAWAGGVAAVGALVTAAIGAIRRS